MLAEIVGMLWIGAAVGAGAEYLRRLEIVYLCGGLDIFFLIHCFLMLFLLWLYGVCVFAVGLQGYGLTAQVEGHLLGRGHEEIWRVGLQGAIYAVHLVHHHFPV